MNKLKAGIVGATGIAGQQFVVALQRHPWFQITRVAASEKRGQTLPGRASRPRHGAAGRWGCDEEPTDDVLALTVENGDQFDAAGLDVVFSATESDVAKVQEARFARTTPVLSTASAYRYEEDVPVLVPNVNLEHASLIAAQRKNRDWKGFIVPGPNCTVTGLVIALKPLADQFGLERVVLTSMQGLSGAGRSPGVIGLDILDNIIPYIPKEEEKVEKELHKILGTLSNHLLRPHPAVVGATCTRANVMDGHTLAVFAGLSRPATPEQVKAALREARNEVRELNLPSAPEEWIAVHDDPFRPQPRLDRDRGNGMTTNVGRVRADKALPNGIKFLAISHNTKIGAAAGSVLVAEYLRVKGYFG